MSTYDAVIISLPFSDRGNKHRDMEDVLDWCDTLGIPVFIDAAYYSIGRDLEIDLSHPCINTISFTQIPWHGLSETLLVPFYAIKLASHIYKGDL